MSLYYEYKSCCSKRDDRKDDRKDDRRDDKKDHDQDCFCDKFLHRFIGHYVRVVTTGDNGDIDGILCCIDKHSGIVTVVDGDDVFYICCKKIAYVRQEAPGNGTGGSI